MKIDFGIEKKYYLSLLVYSYNIKAPQSYLWRNPLTKKKDFCLCLWQSRCRQQLPVWQGDNSIVVMKLSLHYCLQEVKIKVTLYENGHTYKAD